MSITPGPQPTPPAAAASSQGHTSNILSACFLPGTGGGQLLSASADRHVRLVDVAKGAVRPYPLHRGRVRAVVPLDASESLLRLGFGGESVQRGGGRQAGCQD